MAALQVLDGGVGERGSCTINMYLGEKIDEQSGGNIRNF